MHGVHAPTPRCRLPAADPVQPTAGMQPKCSELPALEQAAEHVLATCCACFSPPGNCSAGGEREAQAESGRYDHFMKGLVTEWTARQADACAQACLLLAWPCWYPKKLPLQPLPRCMHGHSCLQAAQRHPQHSLVALLGAGQQAAGACGGAGRLAGHNLAAAQLVAEYTGQIEKLLVSKTRILLLPGAGY